MLRGSPWQVCMWTRPPSCAGAPGRSRTSGGRLLDGLPRPNEVDTDAEGSWEVEGLVSGAPYTVLLSNTIVNFDTGPLAFVADAGHPVDTGRVGPRK